MTTLTEATLRRAIAGGETSTVELKKAVPSPIYDGALLVPGNRMKGPAVIETTDTTVVVHPGRVLEVDTFGNFEIGFGS